MDIKYRINLGNCSTEAPDVEEPGEQENITWDMTSVTFDSTIITFDQT